MDWFKKARRPIAASVEPSRVPDRAAAGPGRTGRLTGAERGCQTRAP